MNLKQHATFVSGRRFVSLGLVLASVLLGPVARPLLAGNQVPFRASFTATATATFEFPFFHTTVIGEGHGQHLGASSSLTIDLITSVISHQSDGLTTLTAANGDQLLIYTVHINTPSNGGFLFDGEYTVVGGTGRFANASGDGRFTGWTMSTSPDTGIAEFEFDGTISSPGSAKK